MTALMVDADGRGCLPRRLRAPGAPGARVRVFSTAAFEVLLDPLIEGVECADGLGGIGPAGCAIDDGLDIADRLGFERIAKVLLHRFVAEQEWLGRLPLGGDLRA